MTSAKYNPETHHRRSIRLKGYDYSQPGAYFVTICTHGKECLFGNVVGGEMCLNEMGKIVETAWFDLPEHYANVESGSFCIMPNHVHAVIVLVGGDTRVGVGLRPTPTPDGIHREIEPSSAVGGGFKPPPTLDGIPAESESIPPKRHPLSEIVRAFKTFSARRINELRNTTGTSLWQRDYYERIIRDEGEYIKIAQYIESNPLNWLEDEEYCDN
ncbi:MAG: transposase [Anaerolineaceae bacterium]|nr:transposase [Anaerolineaceae bacterium]